MQIKMLCLRTISYYHVYHMSAFTPHTNTTAHFNQLQAEFADTFASITQVQVPNLQVHLNRPIEDEGLGYLPFGDIADKLYNSTVAAAQPLFDDLRLAPSTTPPVVKTVKSVWREAMNSRSKFQSTSIFQVWPTNKITTLTDEEMQWAVYELTHTAPQLAAICHTTQFNYRSQPPAAIWKHLHSCRQCAPLLAWHRHEQTNAVMHWTFYKQGFVSSINPKDLPVPGKKRGGPDFILWVHPTPLAGDIAVTHNSTSVRYSQKIRHYRNFSMQHGYVTLPWILSTAGYVNDNSVNAIKLLNSKLKHELVNNSVCAMMKGQYEGFKRLRTRLSIANDLSLHEALGVGSDSDFENDEDNDHDHDNDHEVEDDNVGAIARASARVGKG